MSVANSQVSKVVPKKYIDTIYGDGSTLDFTVYHGLDNEDIVFSAREVEDEMRQVFLDNRPDPSDPKNALIISFEIPPTGLQSFRVLIVG